MVGRETCRACGTVLDPWLSTMEALSPEGGQRTALHPSCDLPIIPPMLPELEGVLARWQNSRPRSLQKALGPSEIGDPCARRLAYKLIEPRKRTDLQWAALKGVWGHAGVEDALHADNRALMASGYPASYRVEERVTADMESGLGGNTDLFREDYGEVVDWKFVGDYTLKKVRAAKHPGEQYRIQAQTYGRGWENRGFEVRSVRIVFLSMEGKFTDSWEWCEPYDPAVVEAALARLARIEQQTAQAEAGEIDMAAIDARPGDACRFCPYLRPNVAADLAGCPGGTTVPPDRLKEAREAKNVDHCRTLWESARAAGYLTEPIKAALLRRVAELQGETNKESKRS